VGAGPFAKSAPATLIVTRPDIGFPHGDWPRRSLPKIRRAAASLPPHSLAGQNRGTHRHVHFLPE
jgi:hypothetical protein